MKIDSILLILCVISIVVYVLTSKVERLDLIDTSDKNPLVKSLNDIKSLIDNIAEGFRKVKDDTSGVLDDIKKAFEKAAENIKKVFDTKPVVKDGCPDGWRDDGTVCWLDTYTNGVGTIPTLNPCPDGSKDVLDTCWLDSECKTTGGDCTGGGCRTVDRGYYNYSWGGANTRCWDGGYAGWGRNDCYRTWIIKLETECDPILCNPVVTTGCPYVTKNIGDRGSSCGANQTNVVGLCYNNCRKGYKFAGGNLCEPDGGVKRIELDARLRCPYEKHTKKVGPLCFRP
jgi:hypothetical protein